MAQDEYKVNLDIFEGPLDLLLYLIKKDEVDIYNIPIERITTQYMEYLDLMKMLDLNVAGEFIVMAATLMMIKSRMLLPVEERPELEEEEEDPRWDLVRQLLEYKKFKDAAMRLQEMESIQENVFTSGGKSVVVEPHDAGTVLQDISLFDLITAFSAVLKRARPEEIGEIFADRFTVADKIQGVLATVTEGGERTFTSFFPPTASKYEVICTFLAILELIRLRQVRVRQEQHFGDIMIAAIEDRPVLSGAFLAQAAASAGDKAADVVAAAEAAGAGPESDPVEPGAALPVGADADDGVAVENTGAPVADAKPAASVEIREVIQLPAEDVPPDTEIPPPMEDPSPANETEMPPAKPEDGAAGGDGGTIPGDNEGAHDARP